MAPNVSLYFYPANDLNGDPLHVITDEDEYFKSLTLKLDLYGLGGAELVLARRVGFAGFGSGTFGAEVFVRVLVHAYSDTEFFTGFFLEKRNQVVISKDEDGGEEFHFGGPGPKAYLERARLRPETFTNVDWHLDLEDGTWRWEITATWTGVMRRLLLEDAASDNPALPDLTFDFDFDDDSAGDDPDEVGGADEFELPIGQTYLNCLWDLEDGGGFSTVELGTVSAPVYLLRLWQDYGDDVSSSTFASGKALLKEGVNITEDALEIKGVALRKCTHVIVEGKDDTWVQVAKPSWDPGEYVKIGKISYTRSRNEAVLNRVGLRWLRRQDNGDQEIEVEFLPGHSDADGLYFPNDGPLALGNIISVDTTADGTTHTPLDIQPGEDQLVTGFELELLPASRDDTALQKDRSWSCKVKLNMERAGNAQHPDQSSATTTNQTHPKCCVHFPPICEEQEPDSETELQDCEDTGWPGVLESSDPCWGGDTYRRTGASGGQTPLISVTAGDIIKARLNFRTQTGYRSWETTINYYYRAYLRFEGPGMPILDTAIVYQLYHNTGCINVEHTATATVPAGYTGARIVFMYRLGGWLYCGSINEITVAEEVVNDPFCVINAGESPYVVRSDDPRLHSTHHAGDVLVEDETGYWDSVNAEGVFDEIGALKAGADFLVGTAQSELGAEIVVGTSPGGELGGTWASPTVDATHSGSAHHAQDHASRHASGGADSVKLDDLAAPDDNSDLNSSTSAHGLLRKLDNSAVHYLDGTGAWSVPGGGEGGITVGRADKAYPLGFNPSLSYATGFTLAAVVSGNGGALAIPIHVPGPMRVKTLSVWQTSASLARSAEGRLYLDNGDSTVDFVTGTDAAWSFTPSAAGIQRATVSGDPVALDPGVYWLVIRNTHASNVLALARSSNATITGQSYFKTHTGIAALGASQELDSGWTDITAGIAAVWLDGRIIGRTAVW